MTAQDLAARAGISRTTLLKIEKGDLKTEIGLVFEVAAIAGVPLFDPEPAALPSHRARLDSLLTLLPQRIRPTAEDTQVDDDF
jgi:DNA-binding XRE family transcriptional regulator